MKKSSVVKPLAAALLGAVLLTGCARRYVMTLQNGAQFSVIGKPRAEGNVYVAKDANGNPVQFSKAQVREIAPASMASSRNSSGFISTVSK